ncbi:hypothetical protein GKZ90_0010290 [Flavobacterium sp. MC2016-06]|jgi:hypothetical protein|uniref:hypothetical protein n=1 Tax=Flavobacterium sp. MC2016-06 TaxID=2676308 RepID=UPI0012BB0F8E|nr:hypothetical protein [Flavobacterium sp. MC2016-06]MBU3858488.1 hypothetical protein [Flavobacterium sp. MC2016-06]
MDYQFYLDKFQESANLIDKKILEEKNLLLYVGVVLDSVCLKLYKKEWSSNLDDPLNAKTRIFFSVWINDKTLKDKRLFYNIHALKLRELKGYSITSRNFAADFRIRFKDFEDHWENINLKLGPLTLMEGWKNLDDTNLENSILDLAKNFLEIEPLIEQTLEIFNESKKQN